MSWIAGVDGCRTGWCVVLTPVDALHQARLQLCPCFADILTLPEAPVIIAVDMPIGLPDHVGPGGRAPETHVRPLLGARQSSVFSVPSRRAVMEEDYRTACQVALETSDPPRKIAKQTFNLFPKIREIDRLMTPDLEARVFECHPEVAFWALNGEAPIPLPKKIKSRSNPDGLAMRADLLERAGFPARDIMTRRKDLPGIGADDALDATVCAWSARRILDGIAHCFPPDPPRDGKQLRQAIWA
ncbi:MAG: DUF429 domain-containing protein [Pseudomonadota bacterium]